MSGHSSGRYHWKQLLASVAVGLSLGSVCHSQESRPLMANILERYDTDGDGQLSASERRKMRNEFRNRGGDREFDAQPPAEQRSLYAAAAGPHAVKSVTSLELTDPARQQPLLVRATYPQSTGRFPVIVFSHGAFGSKDAYDPLVRHWVSHGYVVLQPTHGDSISLMDPAMKVNVFRSKNPFEVVDINKHWRTRAEEIALIVRSLDQLESQHAALRDKLDADRIAVGGHSYGGQTTQLVGGLQLGVDLMVPNLRALLMLSPPGPDEQATPTMYRRLTAPTLVVTGSRDNSPRTGKGYQWRLKTYDLLPAQPKYLLFIEDAEHNLGGISGVTGRIAGGGEEPNHLTYVRSATTAFWDAHLKSESAAQAFMASQQISEVSKQQAKLTRDKD